MYVETPTRTSLQVDPGRIRQALIYASGQPSRFKGQVYRSSACLPLFGPFEIGRGCDGLGSVQLALQRAVTLRRVSERRADAGPSGRVAAGPTLSGDDQESLRYRVLTGVPER
jgi:hypothetical protein